MLNSLQILYLQRGSAGSLINELEWNFLFMTHVGGGMGSSSIQTLGWTGRGVWHLEDFYNIPKVNKNNNLNEHSCAELKQKDSQRREMNVQESRKSKWHLEEKQNKGFQHTNNPQQLRRTKGKPMQTRRSNRKTTSWGWHSLRVGDIPLWKI